MYVIGRGGFGLIWKVRSRFNNRLYALKELSKVKIIDLKCRHNILKEQKFLSHNKHQFLVNLHFSFQDFNNLYYVLDLLQGGDLRYHLMKYELLYTEDQIRFLMANLMLVISFIHAQGVIHRDIKPENILFDNEGYCHLTDFGVAWFNYESILNDNSGTPGYMAPETLFNLNQTYLVDYYSAGVIMFEMLVGYRPYGGHTRSEVRENLIQSKVNIEEVVGKKYSKYCVNFLSELLKRNPESRLGRSSELSEIKAHPFFYDFDWRIVEEKMIQPPFYDVIMYSKNKDDRCEELFNYDYCHEKVENDTQARRRYIEYQSNAGYNDLFRNFTFFRDDKIYFKKHSSSSPFFSHSPPKNDKILQNYLKFQQKSNMALSNDQNLNDVLHKRMDRIFLSNQENRRSSNDLNQTGKIRATNPYERYVKYIKNAEKMKKIKNFQRLLSKSTNENYRKIIDSNRKLHKKIDRLENKYMNLVKNLSKVRDKKREEADKEKEKKVGRHHKHHHIFIRNDGGRDYVENRGNYSEINNDLMKEYFKYKILKLSSLKKYPKDASKSSVPLNKSTSLPYIIPYPQIIPYPLYHKNNNLEKIPIKNHLKKIDENEMNDLINIKNILDYQNQKPSIFSQSYQMSPKVSSYHTPRRISSSSSVEHEVKALKNKGKNKEKSEKKPKKQKEKSGRKSGKKRKNIDNNKNIKTKTRKNREESESESDEEEEEEGKNSEKSKEESEGSSYKGRRKSKSKSKNKNKNKGVKIKKIKIIDGSDSSSS